MPEINARTLATNAAGGTATFIGFALPVLITNERTPGRVTVRYAETRSVALPAEKSQ